MADLKNGDMLYGVTCDAAHCRYHAHDNRCLAENIMVESPNAIKKAETFCGTFVPRSSDQ